MKIKDCSFIGYGMDTSAMPRTRADAAKTGERFFFTGKPCLKGHIAPRYAKAGNCAACARASNSIRNHGDESRAGVRAEKHAARISAIESGQTQYTPVEPCKKGHYKRWTSTNNCVQCDEEARYRHKISAKFSRIKKEYGLSRDEYMAMVERQSGQCAICGQVPESHFSLHVDHCHTTGLVRGLLCGKCNQAIGLFNESHALMTRAMEYLS